MEYPSSCEQMLSAPWVVVLLAVILQKKKNFPILGQIEAQAEYSSVHFV